MKTTLYPITLWALLLLLSTANYAQISDKLAVGINGGMTCSTLSANSDIDITYGYILAAFSGIDLTYQFAPRWSLETDLSFYQSGYSQQFEDYIQLVDLISTKSYVGFNDRIVGNSLRNEWLLGYRLGNRLNFSLQAGFYGAYLFNLIYHSNLYSYYDPSEFNDSALPSGYHEYKETGEISRSTYSHYDMGALAGIRMGYKLNDRMELNFKSRYSHGLINFSQGELPVIPTSYNRSFRFSLGLQVGLF